MLAKLARIIPTLSSQYNIVAPLWRYLMSGRAYSHKFIMALKIWPVAHASIITYRRLSQWLWYESVIFTHRKIVMLIMSQ